MSKNKMRNQKCLCGSNKKYKKCCMNKSDYKFGITLFHKDKERVDLAQKIHGEQSMVHIDGFMKDFEWFQSHHQQYIIASCKGDILKKVVDKNAISTKELMNMCVDIMKDTDARDLVYKEDTRVLIQYFEDETESIHILHVEDVVLERRSVGYFGKEGRDLLKRKMRIESQKKMQTAVGCNY